MQKMTVLLVLFILNACEEGAVSDALCESQEEQHLIQLKSTETIDDIEGQSNCTDSSIEIGEDDSDDEVADIPIESPDDEEDEDVGEDDSDDEVGETFFTVNYVLRDFSHTQAQKMDEAIDKLVEIVNSDVFKQRVLNHTYKGVLSFVDNEGLTNLEIYQKLMQGSETLNPAIDSEMDIDITLYYSNNSTVGYTYPNSERIWVNDKFFRSNSLGRVAANIIHEWTHKLGFDHDYNRTTRRNYSVPYGIGTIVQQLIDEQI